MILTRLNGLSACGLCFLNLLKNKTFIGLFLGLIYCVYIVSTVSIKELENEEVINIAAFYIGGIIGILAILAVSFLPEQYGYLDTIIFAILSIATVLILMTYIGWLIMGSTKSIESDSIKKED